MSVWRYFAKSLVHGGLYCSGWPRRQRRQMAGKLIILTYHSFCEQQSNRLFTSLPVARFRRQLQFLQKNFQIVSLAQGLDMLAEGQVGDQPMAAVTIDDGFADNYQLAWPLLQSCGVPATIFLATDFIDSARSPWPTRLIELLDATSCLRIDYPFRAALHSRPARVAVCHRLKNWLAPMSPSDRFARLQELANHLQVTGSTQHAPLSWKQIKTMCSSGIAFGSHTQFHSILPAVPEAVREDELRQSKMRIEEELQQECCFFAYPDGQHDQTSCALLRASGYQAAVTQDFGVNGPDQDSMRYHRIEVPFDDPLVSFYGRVSLCLHPKIQNPATQKM